MAEATRVAIISIVASAVVSAGVSFGFQLWGDSIAHERAARLQIALDFTSAPDNLIPIATRYIDAISSGNDVSPIQVELRSYLSSEIARAELLRSEFRSSQQAIADYQDALNRLAGSIEKATDATEMKSWIEAFGRVVDARQNLDSQLKEAARA